ncbi:uncharacterized protein SPSK_01974 [Sporothrix schenckii 1099-18]|uniref:CBM-cenC domain-containing protein n=1 Tax=Sporothrix schenckii 1099-18 TaxID=1397361 RepID=A0A0F2MCQ0_SPOSC|nr:uncharacterized protein SPSK_01974 [Sporothrix schenckii 1099-18]KJR86864.1 hypothetical protein SPSK_01974 [Sporothrix schenckii 1099-18]
MKASFILAVGLTWVSAAMGSRCKPSSVSSSVSSVSSPPVSSTVSSVSSVSSASSSASASATCSGNFIVDGDFSDNKLPPAWTVSGTGNAEVNPNCYAHGVSCAHLETGPTSVAISQVVTTVSGTIYDISFSYFILAASKNPTLTVLQDGVVVETIQLNVGPTHTWIQAPVVQVTATGTQTTISFSVNAVPGGEGNIQLANIGMCAYS